MCDTFCIHDDTGTWFAKNSDRDPAEVQVAAWHPARPATGTLATQYLAVPDAPAAAFLGSRPTWLWGCEHGVNEHGVAAGNEKVWTADDPRARPPALLGMDVVRLVLERARTADEALEIATALIERHGQGGSGEPFRDDPYDSSFLFADAHGGWVLETCDRTWAARPVGAGGAISNRIGLGTDWTRASAGVPAGTDFDTFRHPRVPTEHADDRLAVTGACVARRETTLAGIAQTLRDHRPSPSGFTVCLHQAGFHAQTTASMIAHLPPDGPPRAWVCLGNPCVGVYVPVFAGAVPVVLGEESCWRRFAALRDRVEADASARAGVEALLRPLEAGMWAAADEVSAADPVAASQFADTVGPDLDRALRALGV